MNNMKRFPYFTPQPCLNGNPIPEPLPFTVERTVRFEEVDLMAVLWHGHYASYFEDARVALGNFYDIGYQVMMQHSILAPVRQMYVDYRAPLVFDERCTITALLHWSEAARLNLSYLIKNQAQEIVATGYSVQMFIDARRKLMLEQPTFLHDFYQRWKSGAVAGVNLA
ncbi:acyl-CoA thioesterase [Rouxiella sp. Mn2063]|uniref:acyl-CoA thioesterase n=1 Tax=Rouxiella sp. Mn2063 TaxID=3395262 RepID=UPI003BCA85A0